MMRYHFTAKVQRVIEDTVLLSVEAPTLQKAKSEAQKAITLHPTGTSVPYYYIDNRDTIQSQLIDIERVVPTDDQTTA